MVYLTVRRWSVTSEAHCEEDEEDAEEVVEEDEDVSRLVSAISERFISRVGVLPAVLSFFVDRVGDCASCGGNGKMHVLVSVLRKISLQQYGHVMLSSNTFCGGGGG